MSQYHKEGAWWVSPYNEEPGLPALDHPVEIHDATLRDGEQTPGVVFSTEEKVHIAELLDQLGVERIEAGMPAVSQSDYNAIKEICKRGLNAKIFAFVRAVRGDIDMAAECGATGVVIEVPIGYPKLQYQFGWTWEDVLKKSTDCINYARSKGLYVVYFPYDTTRSRLEDLENLMNGIMDHSPPSSVGVVDTMGCATPEAIAHLVRKMKVLGRGIPVEVHTHNDFGMGVATELAGALAGASCIHSCLNGLGERTGNAALEELMMSLKLLYRAPNNYNLPRLADICSEVAGIANVPLAQNKPISGARNYTRESGIGVNLVLEKPLAMFATDPAYFGRSGEIVLGKKSGKASVQYFLNSHGLTATDEQIDAILADIKAMGQAQKRLLADDEVMAIVKQHT